MKNLKKLFQSAMLAMGMYMNFDAVAQTIPTNFFGVNAWMPDTIGNANACTDPPCIFNGKLHQQWGKIKESRAAMVRFGGIAVDKNMPTNYQYIKMIDSIRAKGMEPVIQVPFHNWKYSAQQAAAIVQYINGTKARNVRYWVIGNEPDLEYGYTTAAQVAAYIKPFASAMKAVDPNILIIGPECAWFNQGIIDGLTTPNGPNDITGKDQNGRYYVDIISFHTYPFNGSQSRSQMLGKLTESGQFEANLAYLNTRIAGANNAHNRTGSAALKTAVTEANVNYKNNVSDNLQGTGANSFIGGQFVAEMYGIALRNGVSMMNLWSVVEGGNTEFNIGFLDNATTNRKPLFYHYKMMAENFKGNVVTATSNQSNVKVFSCQNGQNTTVMIINEDQSSNFPVTVKLNSGSIGGSSALKVGVNANIQNEYTDVIQGQSTMLLVFNAQGAIVKKVEYTISHAANNQSPSVKEFSPSGTTTQSGGTSVATSEDEQVADDAVSMKGFEMNVFPNPANSKFTIELDRPNKLDVKFQVEIYDLLGRLVYSKSSVFSERQHSVDLSGQSVAEAVYIVKVREQGDKDNWRSHKVIVFK
jgi:hypothetical protein